MQQVITVTPEGSVAGLQHKPGKGVDLRIFGRASIERASEIVWNQEQQMWEVHILTGPTAGVHLTMSMVEAVGTVQPEYEGSAWAMKSDADPLQFLDYDDAVKMEIAYLNAVRLRGGFNE